MSPRHLRAGMATPSVVIGPARSLDRQSSRDGISSGGEDDGDEEEPWSAQDIEQLESLVRTYGEVSSWVMGDFSAV